MSLPSTVEDADAAITAVRAVRDDLKTRTATVLRRAQDSEGRFVRALSDPDRAEFDRLEGELTDAVARLEELQNHRSDLASQVTAEDFLSRTGAPMLNRAYVLSESGPYRPDGRQSFFVDLYRAQHKADADAAERLRRNNSVALDNTMRTRAGLTTANGGAGEFVPPLWLEADFVKYARPGRPTADICTRQILPPGTDSLNIPKITGGSAVAIQGQPNGTNQNTAINETDLTTTSIAAGVFTVAGGQTISLQLAEQSPLNIDNVILSDLAADYARFLDANIVLNGSGSGAPTGILAQSGVTNVSFTSTAATVGGTGANALYPKIANAIQAVQTSRYAEPTHIVMHPRRWAWIESFSDSSNRPLVVPRGSGASFNPVGAAEDGAPAQGVVGYMLGLPVVVDPNIPTNLGAGTNQDTIIVGKFDDIWLWESHVRAEVFPQTYAQNASLYARLYNYVAFTPARYPQSIALVGGTGLTPPSF